MKKEGGGAIMRHKSSLGIMVLVVLFSVLILSAPVWAQGGISDPEGGNAGFQVEDDGSNGSSVAGNGTDTTNYQYIAGPQGATGATGATGAQGPQGFQGIHGEHGLSAWADDNGDLWKVIPKSGKYTDARGNYSKGALIGRVPELAKKGWVWMNDDGTLYWVSRKRIPGRLVAYQDQKGFWYYYVRTLAPIPEPTPPPSWWMVAIWVIVGFIGLLVGLMIMLAILRAVFPPARILIDGGNGPLGGVRALIFG